MVLMIIALVHMHPIHSYCRAPPSELGDYDNEEHVKDYATDDHGSINRSKYRSIAPGPACALYIHTLEHHIVSLVTTYDNEDHAKDYGTDDHRSSYVHMHPIYSLFILLNTSMSLVTMIMRIMSWTMVLMIIGLYMRPTLKSLLHVERCCLHSILE